MALLTINADLTRTATALERIATSLERLFYFQIYPNRRHLFVNLPAPEGVEPPKPRRPAGPDAVSVVTDEDLWSKEQEDRRQREAQSQDYETPLDPSQSNL